jgi:hypothetical protein
MKDLGAYPFGCAPMPFLPPRIAMPLIFCPDCGKQVSDAAPACIHCGRPLIASPESAGAAAVLIQPSDPPHNPAWIAFASFLFSGLGQIIVGQRTKGMGVLVGSVLLALVSGGVMLLFIAPAAAIDALRVARKLERGEPVEEWEFFPG